MYVENKIGMVKSCITRKPTDQGESLEEMIRRCTETNEPIEATAPMIYTEKKDGVRPEFNIRADRFDIALDAIDKYQASQTAESTNAIVEQPNTPTNAPESVKENG